MLGWLFPCPIKVMFARACVAVANGPGESANNRPKIDKYLCAVERAGGETSVGLARFVT